MKKRAEPDQLKAELREQVHRIERAQQERRTILAQAASLGVLGLLLAIPIVAGAYLGRWLDSLFAGYSIRWTIGLIVLGVFLGATNVYLQLRR